MAGGLALILVVVIYYGGPQRAKRAIFDNERSIVETPAPRTVTNISLNDGRKAVSTGESVALSSGEHLIIEGGKTLKEAYAIAFPVASVWASDAKLVYIRSLGTVTIEGVSSGWEVAFGSKEKKKGYVVSVVNSLVASEGETISSVYGYDVPERWYDAGEAIKAFRGLPQFADVTISGLNFYYNKDGKKWGYAVSSSVGTVSVPVR